ncbi:hypothetical protein AB1K70_24935 [Bremerella sp. JC770]|uniref:hypothetical protein n=1 Tax=Bremerella sp. JC770 TaxID=3232137 RepID=UPI00345B108A
MTDADKIHGPGTAEYLIDQLGDADSLRAISQVMNLAFKARKSLGDRVSFSIASRGLANAFDHKYAKVHETSSFIIRNVFPWCLLQNAETEQVGLRKQLKAWIYSFDFEYTDKLRATLQDNLIQRIWRKPTRSLLFLVSSIGYRSPELASFVLGLSSGRGKLADDACITLISLGVDPPLKDRILDRAKKQISRSRLTKFARIVVQELADDSSSMLPVNLLIAAEDSLRKNVISDFDFALAVSAAGQAVDRLSESSVAHELIWKVLQYHPNVVSMSSDYLKCCATDQVVFDTVEKFITTPIDSGTSHLSYILLSRLGELTKPKHLAAWQEISGRTFRSRLRHFSLTDTGSEGQYMTTEARLKNEAIETLLSLGEIPSPDDAQKILLDEKSDEVALDSSRSLCCFKLDGVTPKLIRYVSKNKTFDDDRKENGALLRQIAIVEVLESCCNLEAVKTLVNLGRIGDRPVLRTTVDAIVNVVLALPVQDQREAMTYLASASVNSDEVWHRNAARSAFSALSRFTTFDERDCNVLWQIASEENQEFFLRLKAMSALAFVPQTHITFCRDSIVNIAREQGLNDLGFPAWEVIVRQKWLTEELEDALCKLIGIAGYAGIVEADQTSPTKSLLIGLLYERNESKYSPAVTEVLSSAKLHAVYPLIASIAFHGSSCSCEVLTSLANRVRESNNEMHADTELFSILATVSPATLLQLCDHSEITSWMVEARIALAEEVRGLANKNKEWIGAATNALTSMALDAAYQVRRAAYRGLSEIASDHFIRFCIVLSTDESVELRKRAAEAVGWLPSSIESEDITSLGLSWDREPEVREVIKGKLIERRQRQWAKDYLERVLESRNQGNEAISKSYCFSRAVAKIGDDEVIKRLESTIRNEILPPNVRKWLEKIKRETERQWRQATKDFPEPWSHETGTLETKSCVIRVQDGSEYEGQVTLWRHQSQNISEPSKWGGSVQLYTSGAAKIIFQEEPQLIVEGRKAKRIFVSSAGGNLFGGIHLRFLGNESYPVD